MSPVDNGSAEEMRITLAGAGSIANAALYNNGKQLGEAIAAAGGTLPGPPTGVAGGALTGTYPNPTLAGNSVTSANIVNGSIDIADLATSARAWVSYIMFNTWPNGQYQQTAVGFSVPTRSTCLFIMSMSAYVATPSTYGTWGMVDGVTGWFEWTRYYHNTTYDHRTYPTGFQQINLNAGSYTFRMYTPSGQYTDVNDRGTCAIVGAPY